MKIDGSVLYIFHPRTIFDPSSLLTVEERTGKRAGWAYQPCRSVVNLGTRQGRAGFPCHNTTMS